MEPLSEIDGVHVIVVDNASADGSLEALAGLPVAAIQRETNGGFAVGCNEGARAGASPFVLFLNPDAAIEGESLQRLVEVMGSDERIGLAAPRIEHLDGSLAYSLRRFPRLRSTFSQALFLHRLAPHADWADETIRDAAAVRAALVAGVGVGSVHARAEVRPRGRRGLGRGLLPLRGGRRSLRATPGRGAIDLLRSGCVRPSSRGSIGAERRHAAPPRRRPRPLQPRSTAGVSRRRSTGRASHSAPSPTRRSVEAVEASASGTFGPSRPP